jgi:NitT/TauT family transport system substrate-binding protein
LVLTIPERCDRIVSDFVLIQGEVRVRTGHNKVGLGSQREGWILKAQSNEIQMKITLRTLLISFMLATAIEAADKVRIGIPNLGGQFMTFPLAQKKGFLKEEGLEAEHVRIFGTVAMAALVSGELDYWSAIGFAVRSAIQGMPVRVAAGHLPVLPASLVARPEIKSVPDLKGKTLGTSVFGGAPEIIARLVLRHFGLDPDKDVKFLAIGAAPETRFAAMKQGLIAATAVSVPADVEGVRLGFHVLAKAYELFSYPDAGLTTTVRKIKEKPDEIKRLIRAAIKANRYIRAEREGTIQFLMEWQKTNRDTAVLTYDSLGKMFSDDGTVPEEGLRFVIEENKKIAKVSREVAFSEVADFTILKQAQNELRIKAR